MSQSGHGALDTGHVAGAEEGAEVVDCPAQDGKGQALQEGEGGGGEAHSEPELGVVVDSRSGGLSLDQTSKGLHVGDEDEDGGCGGGREAEEEGDMVGIVLGMDGEGDEADGFEDTGKDKRPKEPAFATEDAQGGEDHGDEEEGSTQDGDLGLDRGDCGGEI